MPCLVEAFAGLRKVVDGINGGGNVRWSEGTVGEDASRRAASGCLSSALVSPRHFRTSARITTFTGDFGMVRICAVAFTTHTVA
jgi:hypothetical protein